MFRWIRDQMTAGLIITILPTATLTLFALFWRVKPAAVVQAVLPAEAELVITSLATLRFFRE